MKEIAVVCFFHRGAVVPHCAVVPPASLSAAQLRQIYL